ncbi:hypothetical protein PPROV_000874400 [Pycnococcus provasolii]|uniref:Hikeshi-like domain-containing protein n=1 Tax=Pycnococcus provasolii TaxID=41880 RepID=A0A830HX21_9CHLO|nr:hypothetical protein PPROV_000874400 [Pycnococcus provasolii]
MQQQQSSVPVSTSSMTMQYFSVLMPPLMYPLSSEVFTQMDTARWVLDLEAALGSGTVTGTDFAAMGAAIDANGQPEPAYLRLRECVLFLARPGLLQPDQALTIYICDPAINGSWEFRGYVSAKQPSAIVALNWVDAPAQPMSQHRACIGVSVEPLAEVEARQTNRLAMKEDFAKRVGQDLYNFMSSFGGGTSPSSPLQRSNSIGHALGRTVGVAAPSAAVGPRTSSSITVPGDVIDRWFDKFLSKFRRDPYFLSRAKQL